MCATLDADRRVGEVESGNPKGRATIQSGDVDSGRVYDAVRQHRQNSRIGVGMRPKGGGNDVGRVPKVLGKEAGRKQT